MRMLNRNPKRLSAEVFSSAQKQPKQKESSQNCEENGGTTLRNTREKPLLAGYYICLIGMCFPRGYGFCLGGEGALGYFLGGYVPPGTPNWHPILKKISPKIDTPF